MGPLATTTTRTTTSTLSETHERLHQQQQEMSNTPLYLSLVIVSVKNKKLDLNIGFIKIKCSATAKTNVKRQTDNFFQVSPSCYSTDAALCDKVKEVYNDAGKEISKVLKLKRTINVNATFTDLNDENLLGYARASQFILLTSDDKIKRRYPQALVKQFSLEMKFQSICASLLLCILTFTRFLECSATAKTNVKRQTDNFFQVSPSCYSTDAALCDKVKEVYNDAGKEISKVLKLKRTINVNATFTDLNDENLLGYARASQFILLTSDDKIKRRYPQALVKQFSLEVQLEYYDYDIVAEFNSDQNWWFKTDNVTIESNQYDFYATVLHEFMHGLGILSSWNDDLETSDDQVFTGLTPYSDFDYYNYQFFGFYENIFDRYVKFVRNNEKSTSTNYTYQLNMAVANGTSFNSYSEFVTAVKSSIQWKYAEYALTSATTDASLYFTPAEDTSWNEDIELESGIPFESGTSICHVSQKLNTTSDFLITWSREPGITLEESIQIGGNYSSPIGPRILSILESMGYETDTHPNPINPTY
ncbi:hypothetical protein Glove_365g217 [Diversispora epigaea]|uniref:Sequence orphan n=1 Tax=Diversispora epigaea TaxID=1348612 RepID=A0A397HCA3_9GLOM|nr:hypothetical protein Glove_365g217 [Diversispora epigaea]